MNECPHCGDRWIGDEPHGCSVPIEEKLFRLTPKGWLIAAAVYEGLDSAAGTRIWEQLESFCMRELRELDVGEEFAALVFDGVGGTVMGATSAQ